MKKLIFFLLFLFALKNLSAQQADSIPRKSLEHQQGILLYAEIAGHNYYSFRNKNETDFLCINAGYRKAIIKGELYAMISAGYGTFKDKHSSQIPYQPRIYFYDRVHYFPLELSVQLGGGPHYFEFGFSLTPGFGKQELYYGDRLADTTIQIGNAIQHIPRIGYAYFGKDGLMIRLSLTPHFYSGVSPSYGSIPIQIPFWLPFGISMGYLF